MYTSQEMSNLRRFLARFLRDGDADEAVEAIISYQGHKAKLYHGSVLSVKSGEGRVRMK